MRKAYGCLIWLVCFSAAGQSPTHGVRSPVGTNLAPVVYWSPQLPFVDIMKSASAWTSGDRGDSQSLDLDANGWVRSLAPGQVARTLMLRNVVYPTGRYRVRYKGQGTMKFAFAARVVAQHPGEMLLEVTESRSGIRLTIEATDPSDYLREIEITMPGGICEGDALTHVDSEQDCAKRRFLSYADHARNILFYPVFVNRVRSYSVLRFMNWMLGVGTASPVSNWAERTPQSSRTWTVANGVPVEVMIALSNRVNAHPWFTIPHLADDAYVLNFAKMVREKLNPGLHVYVEHSNEVWNRAYKQHAHAVRQGEVHTPPISAMQYHALRSRKVGEIFKGVLGPSRVVTVLGAQAASPGTASTGLEYLRKQHGGVTGIDAVAIAPYFGVMAGPEHADTYTAMSLDELFRHVRTAVLPQLSEVVGKYRDIAGAHGLRLVSYEGGQHMVGVRGAHQNRVLAELFYAFNRDSRMKQLYLDYLAIWKRGGGELFVHFTDVGTYNNSRAFGALEYITQPRAEAPKFDAIQTFIEQNPVWWKPR